jgi:hypothetical protein
MSTLEPVAVIAAFAFAASLLLVVGAKWLGRRGLSRPAGSRPGEWGDSRDDLEWSAPWEDRRG